MQMDNDGDELSGFDEAILPLDFETEGPILDDEMNAMLVQKLAPGAKLTVLFGKSPISLLGDEQTHHIDLIMDRFALFRVHAGSSTAL